MKKYFLHTADMFDASDKGAKGFYLADEVDKEILGLKLEIKERDLILEARLENFNTMKGGQGE